MGDERGGQVAGIRRNEERRAPMKGNTMIDPYGSIDELSAQIRDRTVSLLAGEPPPDDMIVWFSHPGVMTRRVVDTALVLDVLKEPTRALAPGGLRA
jgi:hypothetical protein